LYCDPGGNPSRFVSIKLIEFAEGMIDSSGFMIEEFDKRVSTLRLKSLSSCGEKHKVEEQNISCEW